ncbi:MAG: hypothetical protein U9Q03_04205 [Patescibacteria group bacterium]|nr:hypothetical protein [Patescibacteria group bacterium]
MAAKNSKWRRPGTEGGAGDYELLARGTGGGWYGRKLATGTNTVPGGCNRVRLVPANEAEAEAMTEHVPAGWKRPHGAVGGRSYRFSTVVPVGEQLTSALEVCRVALEATNVKVTVNRAGLKRAAADVA